jgi:hypothetical protein
VHRLLEAERLKDEDEWRRARQIAYEVWRKGGKNAPAIDTYMPIGIVIREMTKEELDDVWEEYGKLKKHGKRI